MAPVLFGSGTPTFDAVTEPHRNVELIFVIHTSNAIHLRAGSCDERELATRPQGCAIVACAPATRTAAESEAMS